MDSTPSDFDWAINPVKPMFASLQKLLGISDNHLRASCDVYRNHGNGSSAAIFSVFDRLRSQDTGPGREYVVGYVSGPGPCIEMCILRRPGVSSKANL